MNTKRTLTGALCVAFVGALALAPQATAAPGAVTGTGADDPGMHDPSGATPVTPAESPVGVYAQGDPATASGGVGVSIGQEDSENSVGKAAVGGSQDGGAVAYAEDYTEGDQIANVVEAGDEATGCAMLGNETDVDGDGDVDDDDCAADSPSDAATVYSEVPEEE